MTRECSGPSVVLQDLTPLPPLFWGSGQSCPRLRALSDHCFIVGALRARRALGRSLLFLLRPRVAQAQEINRLHPLYLRRADCIRTFPV